MRTFQLAVRGLPDLRNAPQTMDFTVRGQTFTADVTPRPRRRFLRDRARARGTRAPTMTFARAKNLVRSAIPE